MIHHVQIACPPGSEDALRTFYIGILGMVEKPKPPALAVRGGCWFTEPVGAQNGVGSGLTELHLGVEEDFRPARKAHPGLLWRDLDSLAARLTAAGYPVTWAAEDEIPGVRRFHTEDPNGNRLEFLAPTVSSAPVPVRPAAHPAEPSRDAHTADRHPARTCPL